MKWANAVVQIALLQAVALAQSDPDGCPVLECERLCQVQSEVALRCMGRADEKIRSSLPEQQRACERTWEAMAGCGGDADLNQMSAVYIHELLRLGRQRGGDSGKPNFTGLKPGPVNFWCQAEVLRVSSMSCREQFAEHEDQGKWIIQTMQRSALEEMAAKDSVQQGAEAKPVTPKRPKPREQTKLDSWQRSCDQYCQAWRGKMMACGYRLIDKDQFSKACDEMCAGESEGKLSTAARVMKDVPCPKPEEMIRKGHPEQNTATSP